MSVQIVSPKRNKSNFCQLLGQQQQKPLQNTWSVMCNISDLCVCILRYLCCGVISTEAPVAFHLQVAECWDILSWSSSQGWKLSGLKSQILPKDFCSAASCQALLKKKKKIMSLTHMSECPKGGLRSSKYWEVKKKTYAYYDYHPVNVYILTHYTATQTWMCASADL